MKQATYLCSACKDTPCKIIIESTDEPPDMCFYRDSLVDELDDAKWEREFQVTNHRREYAS